MPIEPPAGLRQSVASFFGAAGERWLAGVPSVAEDLARRWRLRLGQPYTSGSHALVLPATRDGDGPLALKIPVIDDENYAEAAALRTYAGDGAIRLYEHDPASGALLLERAEPGTALADEPDREHALDRALALWRRLRRPVPAADLDRYPAVTALATRWATRFATERLPGLEAPLAHGATLAARYAAEPDGPPLLINRDAHLFNVLRADREWCLLIDPKPLIGEAAFDGSHPVIRMLKDGDPPITATAAVDRIAAGLGVDPERLWGWALLRALENTSWSLSIDADPTQDRATVDALWRDR